MVSVDISLPNLVITLNWWFTFLRIEDTCCLNVRSLSIVTPKSSTESFTDLTKQRWLCLPGLIFNFTIFKFFTLRILRNSLWICMKGKWYSCLLSLQTILRLCWWPSILYTPKSSAPKNSDPKSIWSKPKFEMGNVNGEIMYFTNKIFVCLFVRLFVIFLCPGCFLGYFMSVTN